MHGVERGAGQCVPSIETCSIRLSQKQAQREAEPLARAKPAAAGSRREREHGARQRGTALPRRPPSKRLLGAAGFWQTRGPARARRRRRRPSCWRCGARRAGGSWRPPRRSARRPTRGRARATSRRPPRSSSRRGSTRSASSGSRRPGRTTRRPARRARAALSRKPRETKAPGCQTRGEHVVALRHVAGRVMRKTRPGKLRAARAPLRLAPPSMRRGRGG